MKNQLSPPEWIDKGDSLKEFVPRLGKEPSVGVDTEANSFYAHREKVCLIQLSTSDQDILIDPLSGLDLSPLGTFFADPKIVKVFHDGEYDIGMLKKDFGFSFANIFDTRIAVMALGCKRPGLASVLKERFGVELNKKYQRSDWGERPLSQGQLEYARLDTHFLISLYQELKAELEKSGRTHVAAGEFRRLENLKPKEQVFDPNGFIRLKGARQLDPLGLQVLKQLFLKREKLAERLGFPPFRIMPNQALIELAQMRPKSLKGLVRANGFTWKLAKRFGEEVLEAIRIGEKKGPMRDLPTGGRRGGPDRLTPEQALLYERLRKWRKNKADQEGFDPSHVLNRSVLHELARSRPRDVETLGQIMNLESWQIETYGREILALIWGRS